MRGKKMNLENVLKRASDIYSERGYRKFRGSEKITTIEEKTLLAKDIICCFDKAELCNAISLRLLKEKLNNI
jgi:hypothetical protein